MGAVSSFNAVLLTALAKELEMEGAQGDHQTQGN